MKICSKCKIEKSLIEFNINISRKDGLQTFCRDCNKAQHIIHYKKNQKLYIENNKKRAERIKKSVNAIKKYGCQLCPENDVGCIDFHHIDSKDKDFGINHLIHNSSLKLLKLEIAKCCLLCSNCHRKLHYYNQNHILKTIDIDLIEKYLPL